MDRRNIDNGNETSHLFGSAALSRRGFVALAALGASSLVLPLASCTNSGSGASTSANTAATERDALLDAVREQMSNMTLEQKVAQLFVARPEDILGDGYIDRTVLDTDASSADQTLTEMSDLLAQGLEAIPVGGVAYFSRNLVDAEQTRSFLADTKDAIMQACGVPPLLCVDEEGGVVARIASNDAYGVENAPDASEIGSDGDDQLAKDTAQRIGEYLRDLGFNTDFAPVADIASDPDDKTATSRSFGDDSETVGKFVAAEVEGFKQADVICSLKHFPGLGAASGDTHLGEVVTDKSYAELIEEDAIPFKAGIEAGAPMVMMGHMTAPNADELAVPSSTSSIIIMNMLRRDLGFEGVVITDALNMGAITDIYDSGRAAIDCFMAGCDMLLMPEDLQSAFDAMLETVKNGTISAERLNESVMRILMVKQRYL